MRSEYLVVPLLAVIAFLLMKQQSQPTLVVQRPMYNPFQHRRMGGFSRNHRFHGRRFRHH